MDLERPPFAGTASVTLRRMVSRGPLCYVEAGGETQAKVIEQELRAPPGQLTKDFLAGEAIDHLYQRYTCVGLDDTTQFYVERYRAVGHVAFAVFDQSGQVLAAYVPDGEVVRLRDSTGAPVATMKREHNRMEIHETGGSVLGLCYSEPVLLGSWFDDAWGLAMFEEPIVFDRRALVAAPLVCYMLYSPGLRLADQENPFGPRPLLPVGKKMMTRVRRMISDLWRR